MRKLEYDRVSTSCSSSTSTASVTDSVATVVAGTALSVVVDVALKKIFLTESLFFSLKPYGSKGFLKGAKLAIALEEAAGRRK